MRTALVLAGLLAIAVGGAHSILGERYILIRLFRRNDLPKLFGSSEFTTRTLRFAWHLTTVCWWGIAVLLLLLAEGDLTPRNASIVIATTSWASFIITIVISRGRHLAWLVFLAIGSVALMFAAS